MPAKYADRAPKVVHTDARRRRLGLRRRDDPQHRAQRRRRAARGGVRRRPHLVRGDAARLLRHPRAGQGHERGRRAREHVLPVVPVVLRAAVRGLRRQGPRARAVARPTTTGTSTSGRARTRGASSRWRCRCCGTRSCAPTRSGGSRPRAATRSRSPRTRPRSGCPSFHDEHWDPMWEALVDEGSILNIHLGSSGKLAVTAPDAPMDVMITLQPMNICMAAADLVWSRVFKEYPDAQGRALRGRHRLDPVLPRPPRPHLRHAPRVDGPGLRRGPHAVRRVPRAHPHVLHRRPGRARAPRRDRHRQHLLGAGLPALRLVVAERARGARRDGGARTPCPTPSSTRSPTRTRCAGTGSTRSPRSRGSSAPSARCGRRSPGTTCRSGRWSQGRHAGDRQASSLGRARRHRHRVDIGSLRSVVAALPARLRFVPAHGPPADRRAWYHSRSVLGNLFVNGLDGSLDEPLPRDLVGRPRRTTRRPLPRVPRGAVPPRVRRAPGQRCRRCARRWRSSGARATTPSSSRSGTRRPTATVASSPPTTPTTATRSSTSKGVAAEVLFPDADVLGTGRIAASPFGSGLAGGAGNQPELALAGREGAQPVARRLLSAVARPSHRRRARSRSSTTATPRSPRSRRRGEMGLRGDHDPHPLVRPARVPRPVLRPCVGSGAGQRHGAAHTLRLGAGRLRRRSGHDGDLRVGGVLVGRPPAVGAAVGGSVRALPEPEVRGRRERCVVGARPAVQDGREVDRWPQHREDGRRLPSAS